jgi:hypothetical protein
MSCAAAGEKNVIQDTETQSFIKSLGPWLDLLQQTVSVEGAFADDNDPHRSLNAGLWDRTCKQIQNGEMFVTCVLDFPYADSGHGERNLNLRGGDRLLERMYCFTDAIVSETRTVYSGGGAGKMSRSNIEPTRSRL